MPKVSFEDIAITSIVTTVGDSVIDIDDEKEKFGFEEKTFQRLKKTIGLDTRYIVSDNACASDLCFQSAETIFENDICKKEDIQALIFVTQSPDYIAPSTAIILQDRLKLSTNIVAFDINLGCSGFVYGLYTVFSLINSGLKKAMLLVGDVNNYFTDSDKTFTPLMGDAGSAILIEETQSPKSHFILGSDGSGFQHLIIPEGGARKKFNQKSLNFIKSSDGSMRRGIDLYMNGAEVFNFAVKTVPALIEDLFKYSNNKKDNIDFFVLHQANPYILKNIANSLDLSEYSLPSSTGSVFGNQNSASIPGTINGFLHKEYSEKKIKSLFAGFGIGLSWAACVLTTEKIFAPKYQLYKK